MYINNISWTSKANDKILANPTIAISRTRSVTDKILKIVNPLIGVNPAKCSYWFNSNVASYSYFSGCFFISLAL